MHMHWLFSFNIINLNQIKMELTKLNIVSRNPYYIDVLGRIYNSTLDEIKGSEVNGSLILSYSLPKVNGEKLKTKKESFARVAYKTYFPEEDIKRYMIFRKEPLEFPYQKSNLEKVLNVKILKKNKAVGKVFSKEYLIKKKFFFEKLNEEDLNTLINMSRLSEISNLEISKLFKVNSETVRNLRPKIKTLTLKK